MKNGLKEHFEGDSWFGGNKTLLAAMEAGHNYFGIIKKPNGHAGFPLDEVNKLMKHWPSGLYLVLECTREGQNIFFLGYRYSGSKDGETEQGQQHWESVNDFLLTLLNCSLHIFPSTVVSYLLCGNQESWFDQARRRVCRPLSQQKR